MVDFNNPLAQAVGGTPVLQINPLANAGGVFGRGSIGALGEQSMGGYRVPSSPEEINPNIKVDLGTLHRGMEAGATQSMRSSLGDLGHGVYATPQRWLAETYGGGPSANMASGSRQVKSYNTQTMYPEDVAYIFGGKNYGEPVHLFSGNGIPLWSGEWSGKNIEGALADHSGIKAVIGTPNSIGVNQISIRDHSILSLQK